MRSTREKLKIVFVSTYGVKRRAEPDRHVWLGSHALSGGLDLSWGEADKVGFIWAYGIDF